MTAVARYLLAEHVRSRGLVIGLVVLSAGTIFLYAQPPNPVLSTAGAVAAFLFPAQCWLALGLFNSQGAPDRQVLAATVGGRTFALGRLLAGGALALAISLLTLIYPLATGSFERTPRLAELGLILGANLTVTVAATALSAPFSQPIVRSRVVAVLGLTGCALLTIPFDLGPAIPTARALDTTDASQATASLSDVFIPVVAFTLVASAVCVRLWRRRE